MKIKKQLYKWHRILSMLIAFPVLLWALSGLLHPVMTTIRPNIATQESPDNTIDPAALRVSLYEVLMRHGITAIYNFRIVKMGECYYYQVLPAAADIPQYYATSTGERLVNGDQLYAAFLAQHFLYNGHTADRVRSVKRIAHFDNEYKQVNQLLPVYRVDFVRPGGIRLYVDTEQSRFSYVEDDKRALFNRLFSIFHTWSWMDRFSYLKVLLIAVLMLMTLCTTSFGLYIFFTGKSKKRNGNGILRHRRNHRYTALFASLFTLCWAFSGCVHILASIKDDGRGMQIARQRIRASDCRFDLQKAAALVHSSVVDISFVQMRQRVYLRLRTTNGKDSAGKDLMKQMSVTSPQVYLIDLSAYLIVPNGDQQYAMYLAAIFSGKRTAAFEAARITHFDYDYNFSDKVLPVWAVYTDARRKDAIYIETATNKLRKRSGLVEKFDAISFAVFHKHEFMSVAGKSAKDLSTVFWALSVIVMVVFGLIVFFKRQRKRR